jgi:hypothetical protein
MDEATDIVQKAPRPPPSRRPIYLVRGRYKASAEQPVWFDEPEWFMAHDGIPLGAPGKRVSSLALYGSVTYRARRVMLWYPDRKFFLLGKLYSDNYFSRVGWSQSGAASGG